MNSKTIKIFIISSLTFAIILVIFISYRLSKSKENTVPALTHAEQTMGNGEIKEFEKTLENAVKFAAEDEDEAESQDIALDEALDEAIISDIVEVGDVEGKVIVEDLLSGVISNEVDKYSKVNVTEEEVEEDLKSFFDAGI